MIQTQRILTSGESAFIDVGTIGARVAWLVSGKGRATASVSPARASNAWPASASLDWVGSNDGVQWSPLASSPANISGYGTFGNSTGAVDIQGYKYVGFSVSASHSTANTFVIVTLHASGTA